MGKAIFQTDDYRTGRTGRCFFFEEGMFVLFGDNVPDTLKISVISSSEEGRRNNQKKEINWLWIRKNISSLP